MAEANTSKSTTKQSVIAVAILLAICFVCVGLLALLNDLLYVSDDVRFARAMSKIYPDATFDVADVEKNINVSDDNYGRVTMHAKASDGAYIIESVGKNGYANGTVTLYVVVKQEGDVATIKSWTIKENVGQSYIGNIPDPAKSGWYIGADVADVITLNSDVITSGATMSSTAINNAINMAALYARVNLALGKNPESEAKAEIATLLQGSAIADIQLSTLLTSRLDHISSATNTLAYAFNGTVGDVEYYALAYDVESVRHYIVYANTLAQSTRVVVAKSDNFPAELETTVLSQYSASTARVESVAAITGATEYVVHGYKIGVPNAYKLKVTINDAGAVTAIDIIVNGFVDGYVTESEANNLIGKLVGATADTVEAMISEYIVAGATNSGDIISNIVRLALNYHNANGGIE